MFLIKLIAAAFLISLNIFTFLLIKFQKSDRDLNLLKSVASGDTDITDKDQTTDPNKKEVEQATTILASEKSSEKEEETDNTQKYSHVYDNSSASSSKSSQEYDDDDDEDDDLPHKKPAPLSKKEKKQQQKNLVLKYSKKPVSDIKLLLCALLGGSLGIYLALFMFKYRLRDVIMMVLVPTFLVINIYLYYHIFAVWLIVPFVAPIV